MATENEYVNNLFREIEMPDENNNEKLPVALFQEIETELSELLFFCRMKAVSQMMRQMALYNSYRTLLKMLKEILRCCRWGKKNLSLRSHQDFCNSLKYKSRQQ